LSHLGHYKTWLISAQGPQLVLQEGVLKSLTVKWHSFQLYSNLQCQADVCPSHSATNFYSTANFSFIKTVRKKKRKAKQQNQLQTQKERKSTAFSFFLNLYESKNLTKK